MSDMIGSWSDTSLIAFITIEVKELTEAIRVAVERDCIGEMIVAHAQTMRLTNELVYFSIVD